MHILILAQTPPPIHGAALINKAVLDALSSHPGTTTKHINISKSNSIYDMQKSALQKSLKAMLLMISTCLSIIKNRKKITYINTAPGGIASIRDFVFLTLASFCSRNVFAHFHGQIPKNSIFLNSSRFLFKTNVTFIFLDESLIPEQFKITRKKTEILSNFAPNEDAYKTIERAGAKIKTVGFLANMLPAKGIDTFLATCASELRAGSNFSVHIAGGWTAKYEEEQYTKWITDNADISDRFTHYGAVNNLQKSVFFNKVDIFYYPTKNDAFPLVLLEAMASGSAILTTDIGAIKNIIADGDLICSTNEDSKKLRLLLDNPSILVEKQKNLRDRYYSKYSHAHFEKNLYLILGVK